MAHDVFVSYATDDKATADAVVATLEQRQIRCWVAPRDIPPGKDYAQALVQAINGSRVLVLVFSAKANASPHVIREIERAASRGIPILPLRIEDVPPSESMEYFISGRHWLDALTTPLRKHLDQLAVSVASLLDAEGVERDVTPAVGAPQAAAARGSEGQPPSQGILGLVGRWRERPMLLAVGAAAAIALVAIIGGFFVLASDEDGDVSPTQVQGDPGNEGAAVQVVRGEFQMEGTGNIVSGDCASEDLVVRGEGEGEFVGDISGHLTVTFEIVSYAATQCQTGFSNYTFTLTDAAGNTVAGIVQAPFDTVSFLAPDPSAVVDISVPEAVQEFQSALPLTITGGTGIYEGITGTGTCSGVIGGTIEPDGSARGVLQGECTIEAVPAGTPAGLEPLIVQLAANPLKVAVSGGSFDIGSTVALAVLYGNTQEEAQTGLSVRLPAPEGAEVLAATLEEAQTASAGERIWTLPDLAPGELARFEFRVKILAAESPTVSLVVEVDGDGFQGPISSDLVTIEIVQ